MTFEAVMGQSFHSHQDWVNRATRELTGHVDYHNTEHDGPAKGWRGHHFTAMCFDQAGNRCRNGGDFKRAEDENLYPVWWIWPDQIGPLLMGKEYERGVTHGRNEALDEAANLARLWGQDHEINSDFLADEIRKLRRDI